MKFWGFFYGNDGDEITGESHRIEPEDLKKYFPDAFPVSVQERSLRRVSIAFTYACFGIVSACKSGRSKKKNLESQLQLAHEIKKLGLHYIAQIGFWDEIWDRSLFITGIEINQSRILAQKFGQKNYIWGEQGCWCCHKTKSDQIISGGDALKTIGLDIEFMFYRRIAAEKSRLLAQLTDTKKKHRTGERHFRVLRRQLNDLKRIEHDLMRF